MRATELTRGKGDDFDDEDPDYFIDVQKMETIS
jgi:hypothetical protein